MNESEWVELVLRLLQDRLQVNEPNLTISQGTRLPYASEIRSYSGEVPKDRNRIQYETDLLISEIINDTEWKPRVVIEAKHTGITTHDAITYSQKASTHKNVHPYLRYGILIGNRKHHPLPGRLFRHGAYFDFMLSWRSFNPSETEMDNLMEILLDEIQASRKLEEIIYESRNPKRERYTYLHRPLRLKR